MATATKPKAKPFRLLSDESVDSRFGHDAILAGLPFAALARLLRQFKGSEIPLLASLGISSRTLSKRKEGGRLTVPESNRLYRIARLLELATGLYSGSESGAIRWLNSPARSFSRETPLQRARTEPGARQVEQLIGRLQHGVFS